MPAPLDVLSYRRDLLDARRVFGITDGTAWFIRIHETLSDELLASGAWLEGLARGLEPASSPSSAPVPGAEVSRLEARHRRLWFSVYLHEYCHFLQLATTPYFQFLHTLWQYQIHLAARLAEELAGKRGHAVPPFRAAVRSGKASPKAIATLRRWDRCGELLRTLHEAPARAGDGATDPLASLAEVVTDLGELDARLRSMERPSRRLVAWLRSSMPGPRLRSGAEVLPLVSWQPGQGAGPPAAASGGPAKPDPARFGGRDVAEGGAAAVQLLYLAGAEGWSDLALLSAGELVSDEQVEVLAALGHRSELRELDRSWRPLVSWALCDLALQSPLHPVYRTAGGGQGVWRWDDLHPGLRLDRLLEAVADVPPPSAGPAEVSAVTGEEPGEAADRLGAALWDFQHRLAAALGWPSPTALAERSRALHAREDDFLTRLRARFADRLLSRPGLALLPVARETHRTLAPLAIFSGPGLREPPDDPQGSRVARVLTHHLLHHGAVQAVERETVDLISETTLGYGWALSRDFIEEAGALLGRTFRLDTGEGRSGEVAG